MKIIPGNSEDDNSVLIRNDLVKSVEEVKIAYYLTERSFERGRNLAKKKKLEFLLWLTGSTDIESAVKRSKPQGIGLVIILDGPEISENKSGLDNTADPLDIEKITLSRI